MKRLKTFKIAVTCLVVAFVLTTSCNKTTENPDVKSGDEDYTELIEKSKAMQEHVEAFKEKMEYYRDNPGVKSGGQLYSADEAVTELESLLNYNFCYTGIECTKKTFISSEVIMPLDDIQRINDPKLMEVYYDKVIDTIQAQMGRVNYTNMKLLMVDIEVTNYDSEGDALISIGSLIGNEDNLTIPNLDILDGWIYGYKEGSCLENNSSGLLDAGVVIQNNLMFANLPAPPPSMVRRFEQITTVGPLTPTEYRNTNDPLDNFKDYRIFYANQSVTLIVDSTRCLSSSNEMPYYIQQYNQIIAEKELQYNLDFGDCIVDGFTPFISEPFIQHDFTIFLGNEWFVYSAQPFDIEDILLVE